MKRSEIRVGHKYKVGPGGLGPAVVLTEPERKSSYAKYLSVDVEYCDAPPTVDEDHRKENIEIREIIREWTDEDQADFEKLQRAIENRRGWQEALLEAGYDGGMVRVDAEGIVDYLTFRGAMAEKVITTLTGHEFPKADDGKQS